MPELPEIETYIRAFEDRIIGEALTSVRVRSPSFLKTWDPPLQEAVGRPVLSLRRIGKRIAWELEGDLFLVIHLMVTGRFHRKAPGTALPRKNTHASFDFPEDSFFVTEMGKQKRATLHLVRGQDALSAHDPGGLEVIGADPVAFASAIRWENRTLKRALTDPRCVSPPSKISRNGPSA